MSEQPAGSLLIELGTEELPPRALDELGAAFAKGIADGLQSRGIAAAVGKARIYNSPRRLAVWIPDVAAVQPDQQQERRGPALNAALGPDGAPSKALLGFAHSCGVDVAGLETLETDKGAWFVYRANTPGQSTAALIPLILAEAIKSLPIPKPMRWGNHDYAFVRPAHWLVMLHGDQVIDGELFGLRSGRMSRGHRFHHDKPVHIVDADSWLDAMRSARVLADPAERRARVRAQVDGVALPGGSVPGLSDSLCDEIANLTEWPVAIACTFDIGFLGVPQEALVTTMETNQKFVPVHDEGGALSEHFIGVANIESKDPAEVRKGYERVIRPRFADAKFFYDEDLKTPLAANFDLLKNVTYQQALGSVWDKSVRVAELARVIANRVGVDAALATRAAELCKCDLLTRMVGEFPELQGVMGRYYALANGENAEVAQALDEFYRPRFAGDAIAEGKVAQVLSVAERLDTLAGIFAVGMKPSGSKDPFALRRVALGLARTLIEGGLELDFRSHIREALELIPEAAFARPASKGPDKNTPSHEPAVMRAALHLEIAQFILERLRSYYIDAEASGRADTESAAAYESVRALEALRDLAPLTLPDFDRRVRAVVEFARLPEAQALAAANKRIGNILRQAGSAPTTRVDAALLEPGAESDLAKALAAVETDAAGLMGERDYLGLLKRLAGLREPVDRYFTDVMVMVDDAGVRANRLALLANLRSLFLRVADIALLPTG